MLKKEKGASQRFKGEMDCRVKKQDKEGCRGNALEVVGEALSGLVFFDADKNKGRGKNRPYAGTRQQ